MLTPILRGEKIIKEGLANHWREIEAVGGRLFLTSQRIVFESYALNIQTGNTIIPISEINFIEKGFPNIMNIYSGNNLKNAFVVWGRTKLIRSVNKVKKVNSDV